MARLKVAEEEFPEWPEEPGGLYLGEIMISSAALDLSERSLRPLFTEKFLTVSFTDCPFICVYLLTPPPPPDFASELRFPCTQKPGKTRPPCCSLLFPPCLPVFTSEKIEVQGGSYSYSKQGPFTGSLCTMLYNVSENQQSGQILHTGTLKENDSVYPWLEAAIRF